MPARASEAAPRAPRTYLFVPGDRPERIPKALASGADAVIVDLEDAVGPDAKLRARAAVADALPAERPVLIRVNGPETQWFDGDLDLCSESGVAGVVLPKTESIEPIRAVAGRLGGDLPILPLIETARGMANAQAIAQAAWVERLLFGALDLQAELGIAGDNEELHYFRSHLVLVSRVADILPPVDGVTTALDDPDVLRADTERARRFGFGAKLCIHPKQVALVNEIFSPTAEEIAWARRVVAAAEAAQGGAVAVDGKMVDRPVLLRARAILDAADR
jgi:citrate lyase subunit beta/citryl-CoA lyase